MDRVDMYRYIEQLCYLSCKHLTIDIYPGRIFVITDVPRNVSDGMLMELYLLSFNDRIKDRISKELKYYGTPPVLVKDMVSGDRWSDHIHRLCRFQNAYDDPVCDRYEDIVMTWKEMVVVMQMEYDQRFNMQGDFCS